MEGPLYPVEGTLTREGFWQEVTTRGLQSWVEFITLKMNKNLELGVDIEKSRKTPDLRMKN